MHSEFVSESHLNHHISSQLRDSGLPCTTLQAVVSLPALCPVAGCLLSQSYRQSRRILLKTVLIEKLSYIPFHIVTGRVKEPF